jgi:hypothetical protein
MSKEAIVKYGTSLGNADNPMMGSTLERVGKFFSKNTQDWSKQQIEKMLEAHTTYRTVLQIDPCYKGALE